MTVDDDSTSAGPDSKRARSAWVKAWLLGVGLSPLWGALLFAIVGSSRVGPEFWHVAPWFLPLLIPACGVSLLLASVPNVVYQATEGSHGRRLAMAALWFVALVGMLAAALGWWSHSRP